MPLDKYRVELPNGTSFTVGGGDSDFACWNAADKAKELGYNSCRATLFLRTKNGEQRLGEFDLDGV